MGALLARMTRVRERKRDGRKRSNELYSATQTDVAVKKIKSVFDNVIDGKRILREIRLMR